MPRAQRAASPVTETPLLELRGVSKRFVKTLDAAGRIARRLGANVREEVVHAGLEVRDVVGAVGQAGAAFVEADHAAVGAEPVEERGVPRLGPVEFEV